MKRSNIYYYRRVIQKYKNITISLKTPNYDLAIIRYSYFNLKINQILYKGLLETMTKKEIDSIVDKYKKLMLEEEINEYSEKRDKELTLFKEGQVIGGHTSIAIQETLDRYKAIYFSNNNDLVKDEAYKILQRSNLLEDFKQLKTDEEKLKFFWALLKVEIDILSHNYSEQIKIEKKFQTQDQQNSFEKKLNQEEKIYYYKILQALQLQQESQEKKSLTIDDIFNQYMEEKASSTDWSPKNIKDLRYVFSTLSEYFENKEVDKLSREDFVDFRENVLKNLPKHKLRNDYTDKSLKEILGIRKRKKYEPIGITTINKHLRRIHQVFNWADSVDLINKNLTKNLEIKMRKDKVANKDKRDFFTKEELEILFNSKLFTEDLEKNLLKRPERILVPIIMLYTGAKPAELGLLEIKDIIEKEGILCFDFNKFVKTNATKRTTPIPDKLLELGFLNFYKKRKKEAKKNDRLFNKLLIYESGSSVINEFNTYFRELKKQEPTLSNKLSLYSFRHTVIQKLKEKKTEIYLINAYVGHTLDYNNKAVTDYGNNAEIKFSILKEVANSIHYEIDFSDIQKAILKIFS
jgi:integrase